MTAHCEGHAMKPRHGSTTLLFVLAGLVAGCIAPKEYRPVGKLTPLTAPPAPDATDLTSIAIAKQVALPVGTLCTDAKGLKATKGSLTPAKPAGQNESGPCLAFVEYQSSGRRYDERQIESAVALVQKAIEDDPNHQPIIVGFVHGWKHNADPGNGSYGQISRWPPEDTNIQGLEHVLNFMYRCYYADPATKDPCLVNRGTTLGATRGHVVIGIFFGWYAANISPFWPVAQQMTVYTRGNEADKVAKEGDLSTDLKHLSDIAHPSPKSANEPMLVLVGHSFGARLLEQAVQGPLQDRITQQIKAGPQGSVPNFADLVLYVNSAAPAEDGIGMLQFLAQHEVTFRTRKGVPTNEPLLAAITTPADAATGIIFTIAMSLGSLSHSGIERIDCFDPVTPRQFVAEEDRQKLYRNTLGHLQEFQSHSLTELPNKNQQTCSGSAAGQFLYWVPGHCFEVSSATPMPQQSVRWNGTPYWVISTDESIIPDHSTIFTNRLLRFVGHVLPDERDEAVVEGK